MNCLWGINKSKWRRMLALKDHEVETGFSWYGNTSLLIMGGKTVTHYLGKIQGQFNFFPALMLQIFLCIHFEKGYFKIILWRVDLTIQPHRRRLTYLKLLHDVTRTNDIHSLFVYFCCLLLLAWWFQKAQLITCLPNDKEKECSLSCDLSLVRLLVWNFQQRNFQYRSDFSRKYWSFKRLLFKSKFVMKIHVKNQYYSHTDLSSVYLFKLFYAAHVWNNFWYNEFFLTCNFAVSDCFKYQ